jgi:hypothetical protein
MQKKIYVFCLALCMISFIPKTHAQKGKSELAFGYGYYSIYTLANGQPYNASTGSFCGNYRYYLTKDVTLGLGVGAENISTWGSFVTIAPEVTVSYMDTRDAQVRVKIYGSFSYGVTIFNDNQLGIGKADNSGLWAYGFQATPFGLRVGRQIAGFVEIGVGYKGLFNTGVAIRVPHTLKKNRHPTAE